MQTSEFRERKTKREKRGDVSLVRARVERGKEERGNMVKGPII